MTPEQFVVWLKGYLKDHEAQGVFPLGFSPASEAISYHLSTVVLKTQPPQPGVPGVLGQGLMKLERQNVAWASVDPQDPNHQVQLDTSEVPVFRGGGCQ